MWPILMSFPCSLPVCHSIVRSKPGADNPTYLKKGSTDMITNAIGGFLVFVGFGKVCTGLYHMSFGTNILEIE